MIIPNQHVLGGTNGQFPFTEPQGDTGSELRREWANPSVVVATVLMFIGGNVIQEAFAQSTGKKFTPVPFSFGWPAYALSSLKGVLGEGRLLPAPDYPVKVFNLMSGYYRVNKNWIIGRIMRDHVAWISKADPSNNVGIRIAIYEAEGQPNVKSTGFRWTLMHPVGAAVMILQLIIAAIPTIRTDGHEWGILAITTVGTILSLLMGSLPQWRVEKVPRTRDSSKVFALTAGNGSRDVMIIKGAGRCIDLECLATLDSPMTASPWATIPRLSIARVNSDGRDAKMVLGRPRGYQITRCVCVFEAIAWLLILISLAGIRSHTWCLIAVGAIGLVYNNTLADLERLPKARNMPLKLLDKVSTRKIMDGLMDLEMTHPGCGRPLLQEFFPGKLRPDEEEWWNSSRDKRKETAYDKARLRDYIRRGRPGSMIPDYRLHERGPTSPGMNKPHAVHVDSAATVTSTTNLVESTTVTTSIPQPLNRTRSDGTTRTTTTTASVRITSPPTSPRLHHPTHHRPAHLDRVRSASIQSQNQDRIRSPDKDKRSPKKPKSPPPHPRQHQEGGQITNSIDFATSGPRAGTESYHDDTDDDPAAGLQRVTSNHSQNSQPQSLVDLSDMPSRPYWD